MTFSGGGALKMDINMVRFQGLNALKPVRATCRLNMLFVATQAPEHGGRQVINVLSSNSSKSLRNYVSPPPDCFYFETRHCQREG